MFNMPEYVGTDLAQIGVDRTLCSGHGICAALLPGTVELDEWGYPIVVHAGLDPQEAETAIRMCPARALYRRSGVEPSTH